jgi:pyridoxamine 5'-phosphate oxidase
VSETAGADPNPIALLANWIDEAAAAGAGEPNAMALATAGSDGQPSVRMVLLRGLDDRGLRFYTSYFSRKGRHLDVRPYAAAVLHWPQLERQVRVEGAVSRLSDEESDAYFARRPRGHQIEAWASEQSEILTDRRDLMERYAHFEERFAGEEVPRPHSWGGYMIVPETIEFWQGCPNRLHMRTQYARARERWNTTTLQP